MKSVKKDSSQIKIGIVRGALALGFLAVVSQLFKIQIIDHARYDIAAKEQHWSKNTISAIRGDIFSSDNYLLASTQTYYLVYAEPNFISDKNDVARKLAQFFYKVKSDDLAGQSTETQKETVLEEKDLFKKYYDLINRDLLWVAIENGVSPEVRDALTHEDIKGIGFEEEPKRYYPEDSLGAHVLGFVASDEKGEKRGYYGIEGIYNEDLKGRPGRLTQEVDATGTPILIGGYKRTQAISGSNIYLSLNRAVQFIVEQKLKEGVEKYDAKSGTVIVMDPFTGDILAMANYPSYSPLKFDDFDEEDSAVFRKKSERRNLAIASTYEPGSVMKPFTISTAVSLNVVNPQTTFNDNGPVNYSGKWIDNWDSKHYNTQTIIQLLQKSNNIGAAWVGHQVGTKNLRKYLSDFGFGHKTGIELEGEDSGILREIDTWTDIDLANISFGQGISATPLQVLNAFNVFANSGYLLQPRIVQKIVEKDKHIEVPTTVVRRVISDATAATMLDMLEKAAEGGEAKFFVLKNYRIAGKTGTAQIPVEGKYDPNKTNATFVGFLSGHKNFSMIVKLQEPRTKIFASESAVPLWMDIATELTKYYGLAPDKGE